MLPFESVSSAKSIQGDDFLASKSTFDSFVGHWRSRLTEHSLTQSRLIAERENRSTTPIYALVWLQLTPEAVDCSALIRMEMNVLLSVSNWYKSCLWSVLGYWREVVGTTEQIFSLLLAEMSACPRTLLDKKRDATTKQGESNRTFQKSGQTSREKDTCADKAF